MGKRINRVFFVFLVAFVVGICSVSSFAEPNVYWASNERELKSSIERAFSYECIRITDDIELRGNLYIDKSLVLDLGGHTLYLADTQSSIVTGNMAFSHKEAYEEKKPGYYTHENEWIYVPGSDDRIFGIKKVWHPATVEIRYRDVYNYYDGIEVDIENGAIRHVDGLDGRDGMDDTWSDYHGLCGETPSEVFRVISGSLRLNNVNVYGGYGGNGGDGRSQRLRHVPFIGGGDAGNGGNGGNGGDVVNLTRGECNVFLDGRSLLTPGQAGKGGKRGNKNKNYWVYSGSKGKNGEDGESGIAIRR